MDREPWPILRFLNGEKEIARTANRLPHWQQENAAYFVTYRLADSIPAAMLPEWREEKQQWLIEHSQPWDEETAKEYRRLVSRIDRYLDEGHGSCTLADPINSAVLSESFMYHDTDRYLIHAWVVMPNHIHILFSLRQGSSLDGVISTWKRFTARTINHRQDQSGNLWQEDYFDRMIRDWDHFINVARYIRRNPMKARLSPGKYLLHTAPWVERLLS